MINKRRVAKRKQRLESEGLVRHETEKRRQIIEDKLKALGYYKGKAVIFMLSVDGTDVKGLSVERKPDFMEPVHCRCTYSIEGKSND